MTALGSCPTTVGGAFILAQFLSYVAHPLAHHLWVRGDAVCRGGGDLFTSWWPQAKRKERGSQPPYTSRPQDPTSFRWAAPGGHAPPNRAQLGTTLSSHGPWGSSGCKSQHLPLAFAFCDESLIVLFLVKFRGRQALVISKSKPLTSEWFGSAQN